MQLDELKNSYVPPLSVFHINIFVLRFIIQESCAGASHILRNW